MGRSKKAQSCKQNLQNSKYNSPVYNAYKIKVWITWQDYFLQENDPYFGDVVHERILETVMIAYN